MQPLVIDGYRCFQPLGRGGLGEVYRADRPIGNHRLAKEVAFKRLWPELRARPALRHMVSAACQAWARLSGGNVVGLEDVRLDEEEAYLVTDLVEGVDLGTLMRLLSHRQATLPWELAVLVAQEILRGLDSVHHRPWPRGTHKPPSPCLVHGDLSPSNVLVSFGGEVQLTDVAVAWALHQSPEDLADVLPHKLAYLSPELVSHSALIGPPSDLFSVGVLLHELLTGKALFARSTAAETARAIEEFEGQPVALPSGELPAPVEEAVHRLLARQPADRFASAAAAYQALAEVSVDGYLLATPFELGRFVRQQVGQPDPPSGSMELSNVDSAMAEVLRTISSDEPPSTTTHPDAHSVLKPLTGEMSLLATGAIAVERTGTGSGSFPTLTGFGSESIGDATSAGDERSSPLLAAPGPPLLTGYGPADLSGPIDAESSSGKTPGLLSGSDRHLLTEPPGDVTRTELPGSATITGPVDEERRTDEYRVAADPTLPPVPGPRRGRPGEPLTEPTAPVQRPRGALPPRPESVLSTAQLQRITPRGNAARVVGAVLVAAGLLGLIAFLLVWARAGSPTRTVTPAVASQETPPSPPSAAPAPAAAAIPPAGPAPVAPRPRGGTPLAAPPAPPPAAQRAGAPSSRQAPAPSLPPPAVQPAVAPLAPQGSEIPGAPPMPTQTPLGHARR